MKKFWDRVDIRGEDECWEWQRTRLKQGYGVFYKDKIEHRVKAHRMSYGVTLTKDMFVLHSCDNPPFVNPKHLRIGDYQDNVDDRVQRNRSTRQKGESI